MTIHVLRPPFFKRALVGSLALALASCSTLHKPTHTEQVRQPTLWPGLDPVFNDAASQQIEKRIDDLIAQMSIAQKVGQITQAEVSRTTPEDVKKYHIGSVLNGGGGFLDDNKHASVNDWVEAMDKYYLASVDTSDGGLAIPIIWGTDAVHGHNKLVGATIFPHNIGLGATRNGELVRRISEITAIQVRATGMDWTFSPAVSVARNDRWGRTYEAYSEDPQLVAKLGRQSILGYQGDITRTGYIDDHHIVATAKHYLADGGTVDGVDRGNNYDSERKLMQVHGYPYFDAIRAGVLSVMASHSSWQDVRLHGEKYLLTDILKNRLGFQGLVVGDWNSHGLVEGCTNTHCPAAINAGVDLLMVPFDWREFIDNTIEDVNAGRISMERLDDAVRRVLRVKFRGGLMDGVKPSERLFARDASRLAAPEYREVARQAVRESLVLLKNNDRTLPVSPRSRVLVAGSGADNIPQQCGGWTVSWQATDTTNEDFPNATSIYDGIRQSVVAAGGQVELAVDGDFKTKPDVAIVVFGESPYAEWQGDLRHLGYQTGDHSDAKLLERLQAKGIKTISVFISGRPLWVNRALNASDAFVAAWLPGTEGAGVADVLFTNSEDRIRYDFTGRLSFSWPKTLDQTEVNVGDKDYDPLFPFGYGLNYNSEQQIGSLPTDEEIAITTAEAGEPLFVGKAQDPWQVYATNFAGDALRYRSGIAQNGALTLTEADQNTQGDAINALWTGDQWSALQINNPNANRNFTEVLDNNGALVFDVRLLQPADEAVKVQMACLGKGCEHTVDITTQVNASPLSDWNQLSISLACFAKGGIRFEEVTRAFSLQTRGSLEIQVANVRLAPGVGTEASVQCRMDD